MAVTNFTNSHIDYIKSREKERKVSFLIGTEFNQRTQRVTQSAMGSESDRNRAEIRSGYCLTTAVVRKLTAKPLIKMFDTFLTKLMSCFLQTLCCVKRKPQMVTTNTRDKLEKFVFLGRGSKPGPQKWRHSENRCARFSTTEVIKRRHRAM